MKYNLTFILILVMFIVLPELAFFYSINRGNESCELVSADSGNQDKLPLFFEENMQIYCECGCGRLLPNADKGQRFIRGHNMNGKKLSSKIRKKISELKKGIKFTEEHKRKISKAHKGKIFSAEHKRKLSEAKKGKYIGENNPNWGKHHTLKTKQKMSEAKKGENNWCWKGGKKDYYKRKKNDLKYRINSRMRVGIRKSLKIGSKNNRHWCDLVGYNTEQLKKHLQKTMPEGYTWQNFLNGDLHIDHIIPINAHSFDKPEHIDFKRCWTLSNLQLLPAFDNKSKHDKLIKTFQPSLKI